MSVWKSLLSALLIRFSFCNVSCYLAYSALWKNFATPNCFPYLNLLLLFPSVLAHNPQAGCEDTQAFKSIYEGAVAAGCIQLTAKAQITSTMGTLKVASPKDVCFQYGPDMTCISEVDKHIDDILEKQFVFAKNITELKEELVNTIGKELQVLQTEMAIKVGALEDSVEANTGTPCALTYYWTLELVFCILHANLYYSSKELYLLIFQLKHQPTLYHFLCLFSFFIGLT